MRLSQDAIRRMVGNGGGVVGGGGGSFDPSALAGYASQAWVDDNYISKLFFSRMFTANGTQKVYTSTDGGTTWGDPVTTAVTIAPNEITPSEEIVDGETSGTKIKTVRELSNIQAMVGLWTNQYLSALGLNSSGGGGGASTLNDLLDVNISSPTNGQILKYDSTSGKWVNGSAGGVGTVTSITAGTGLSGGTITSSGTIAINSTYQGYISHGETAYGWGDHAQAGYATPSSVASQMQTYAKIQSGTITIGDTSITPLTSDSGTFWGQSWSSGGTVSGNMSNVGNIVASAHGTKYIDGFRTIELYGAAASGYGGYIDFHFNDDSNDFTSRIIEDASGRIYLNASNGVRIGNGVLKWDSTNNALKVEKYDGTTANFYATGGVSALGVGTGGSVTNLDVTGKITFADNYKIEVSAGDMYIGDSTNEQYVKVSDMCSWNGSTYWYITASGNARFQRIYLDASRYIYVSNGTFYFYNGSTSKEIAFV